MTTNRSKEKRGRSHEPLVSQTAHRKIAFKPTNFQIERKENSNFPFKQRAQSADYGPFGSGNMHSQGSNRNAIDTVGRGIIQQKFKIGKVSHGSRTDLLNRNNDVGTYDGYPNHHVAHQSY